MRKTRIFLVEDEALIVMEIKDRLEELGYEVSGAAARGEDALESISGCAPDLVLMDIRLKGKMDGIETAHAIRSRFDIPVIYLTAHSDEKTMEMARISEPFGYLHKPFDERSFRSAIEIALYKHSIEKKLRESELRYRTLFEAAGDAIFILEAEGNEPGRIVDANQAAVSMHGYTTEELHGLNIRDLDAPNSSEKALERIQRVLKGEWIKEEIDHIKKDGTVFPVEISAGLLVMNDHKYVLAIDRDITGRRRIEEDRNRLFAELQETFDRVSRSHKEWQDTFDSITDLIYITDSNYNVVKANRAFAEYCGTTPKEAIGKKCYALFHKGDGQPPECPHVVSMNEGRLIQSEYTDRQTNRVFVLTAFPYSAVDGKANGSIVVGKDITDEKDREMRLIMSERLASLGQMASGIAHEINNPLASIAGCAEGLLKRVEKDRYEPAVFKNYLSIIQEELLRCKGITDSMLSFVRKSSHEKKAVHINDVVSSAIEIMGFQGRLQEIDVKISLQDGLPVIYGSEGELKQVFIAMIINSLDAMENRGRLMINTESSGDFVKIMISDTGPGIKPEDIDRIFDPFFSTKTEKGGTGLGLSIASKIVTGHGGTIEVSSMETCGATFTISLPS